MLWIRLAARKTAQQNDSAAERQRIHAALAKIIDEYARALNAERQDDDEEVPEGHAGEEERGNTYAGSGVADELPPIGEELDNNAGRFEGDARQAVEEFLRQEHEANRLPT